MIVACHDGGALEAQEIQRKTAPFDMGADVAEYFRSKASCSDGGQNACNKKNDEELQ